MKNNVLKKSICTLLACASVASLSIPAFAGNTAVYVDGEKVSDNAYNEGTNIMVPLRSVAEKLGYDVSWDKEHGGVKLDDGEVNTVVYIGEDNYYMASSTAIGMSAPTSLGAAPVIKDDMTFVPAGLFNVLACGENTYTAENGKITFTKEETLVGMPNPFTEYKTIDEAKKTLKFEAKLPSAVPSGYKLEYVSVMSDDFLNLTYKNGEKEITYRTAAGTEDISGDYTVYKTVKDVKIGGMSIKIRLDGSDFEGNKLSGAVWNDGENSYSVYSNAGLSETDLTDIIKNIK